jgi:hypothetical protein
MNSTITEIFILHLIKHSMKTRKHNNIVDIYR